MWKDASLIIAIVILLFATSYYADKYYKTREQLQVTISILELPCAVRAQNIIKKERRR